MDSNSLPHVYQLTDITGRTAGNDRSTVTPLFKIQVRWTTMRAALISLPIAFATAGFTAMFIGGTAIIVGLAVMGLSMILLTWRSPHFGESMARNIYTRYRDKPGIIFLAGQPVIFTPFEGILADRCARHDHPARTYISIGAHDRTRRII